MKASMISYDEIRNYILEKYEKRVTNRWISEIKRDCDMLQFFAEGEEDKKTCPKLAEKYILEAFEYFDMLDDRNDLSNYDEEFQKPIIIEEKTENIIIDSKI